MTTGIFGGIIGGSGGPPPVPPPSSVLVSPTISAVSQLDPLTGRPEVVLTVENQQPFNLCPEADSTFETGTGSATPVSNCVIMQTQAQALNGISSLAIIAIADGAMTVQEGPYPVNPSTLYSFTAAYRAMSTVETVSVSVEWYDDTDTLISTTAGSTFTDSASAWETISPMQQAMSPPTAVSAVLLHTVANAAAAIAVPAEPTVTPTGTGGSTTWHYEITAYNANGETSPSVIRTITNGNATLNGTNYNAVSWSADTGATGYNVYRSAQATCANIAADFSTCAALITDFATCADLITYVPQLFFIGTTTSTGLHDTGLTASSRIAPSINMTGETHYVDEVGLFPGVAAAWIEAPTGSIIITRTDGQFVIGASPLFPLTVSGNPAVATVTDYTAAYGLPVSYSAVLTANQLASPPSVPSAPVMMGQAQDTTSLYDRLGWAKNEDATGALLGWLSGIGQMVQAIDTVCVSQSVDGTLAQPWSQVFDLTRCPTAVLPWLGQFVGVRVDTAQRDDQQRYAIEQEAGFQRGTPAAILATANKFLLPGYSASIAERDTSPYHLTIDIPAAGVLGNATCRQLYLQIPTCADVFADYATCQDLWDSVVPIENAVNATIPGGLVAVISFV